MWDAFWDWMIEPEGILCTILVVLGLAITFTFWNIVKLDRELARALRETELSELDLPPNMRSYLLGFRKEK